MIFFYNKKDNNRIFNVIYGRVHPQDVIDKVWVQPSDLKKNDIGKYVVPFKEIYREEIQPVYELRVVDPRTGRVEKVEVGKQKVRTGAGMEPDVPFKEAILKFEESAEDPFDYYLVEDKGKITNLTKHQSK